jgi:hypothetical protein
MKRKQLFIAAVAVATLATVMARSAGVSRPGEFPCPGKQPSALSDYPSVITIRGQELMMDGWVWQDSEPPGSTGATVRLHRGDTNVAVPRVSLVTAWVACGNKVRQFTPTGRIHRRYAGESVLEFALPDAPDWGPFTYDDFLVRLRDSTGRLFYLRAGRRFIAAGG